MRWIFASASAAKPLSVIIIEWVSTPEICPPTPTQIPCRPLFTAYFFTSQHGGVAVDIAYEGLVLFGQECTQFPLIFYQFAAKH